MFQAPLHSAATSRGDSGGALDLGIETHLLRSVRASPPNVIVKKNRNAGKRQPSAGL